jgi:membrane protein implicated in regulation of membrane protease activity
MASGGRKVIGARACASLPLPKSSPSVILSWWHADRIMCTFTRYILLQIPGWLAGAAVLIVLWDWFGLAPWMAAVLFGLYVAKDLLVYPLVRRAYERGPAAGAVQLVGCVGRTRQRLQPAGYVLVRGELWRAEARNGSPIEPGTAVRVMAARGYTLEVEPDE